MFVEGLVVVLVIVWLFWVLVFIICFGVGLVVCFEVMCCGVVVVV